MSETQVLRAVEALFLAEFGNEGDGLRLSGGHEEPFYRASRGPGHPAEIHYREDFLNSCLHEIAHWLVAGSARRRQDDFGYAYVPDGRSPEEQREFYRQEIKPQALEWELAETCGLTFRPSADNLNGFADPTPEELAGFSQALADQRARWRADGFPPRADRFLQSLRIGLGRSGDRYFQS